MRTGQFELAPNSLEGKWFWDSPGDAVKFGPSNVGPGAGGKKYYVIEADVPDNAPGLFKVPGKHDGIGPARYLPIEGLQGVKPRPVEVP
jgi:hypothetical protein